MITQNDLQVAIRDKNAVYTERAHCVAFIAKLALAQGWNAGRAVHPKEDTTWEDDWRHMVFIDLPTGQVSWHFHDTEVWLIDDLPWYNGVWDGHTTSEKYQRVDKVKLEY